MLRFDDRGRREKCSIGEMQLADIKQLKEEVECLRHMKRLDPSDPWWEEEKIQGWYTWDKAIT